MLSRTLVGLLARAGLYKGINANPVFSHNDFIVVCGISSITLIALRSNGKTPVVRNAEIILGIVMLLYHALLNK